MRIQVAHVLQRRFKAFRFPAKLGDMGRSALYSSSRNVRLPYDYRMPPEAMHTSVPRVRLTDTIGTSGNGAVSIGWGLARVLMQDKYRGGATTKPLQSNRPQRRPSALFELPRRVTPTPGFRMEVAACFNWEL